MCKEAPALKQKKKKDHPSLATTFLDFSHLHFSLSTDFSIKFSWKKKRKKRTSSLTFPEQFKENKPTQEDSEKNKEHTDQQRQRPLTKLRRRLRQHLSGRHPAGGNLPWRLSRFQKLAKVHTILFHQLVHHLARVYLVHGFPILQFSHGGCEVNGVD